MPSCSVIQNREKFNFTSLLFDAIKKFLSMAYDDKHTIFLRPSSNDTIISS